MTQWVSDRGTHFKNELVHNIGETLKSSRHFILSYFPWSNGIVEVVHRELLRESRAILSEFHLPIRAWPSVVPLVQSSLNNSCSVSLGNRCPLTALTGFPQDCPILSIKRSSIGVVRFQSLSEKRFRQLEIMATLQQSLDVMHKHVASYTSAKRRAPVESHNRKTNVMPVNFTVGDFVLRGTANGKTMEALFTMKRTSLCYWLHGELYFPNPGSLDWRKD